MDNNILLSDHALKLPTQGVALVHNLIAGSFTAVGLGVDNGSGKIPCPRYTPYHLPHRTEVAGFMTILHGDMRFYNNIFIQRPIRPGMMSIYESMKDSPWSDGNPYVGTFKYEGYPDWEQYLSMFEGYCGMGAVGDRDKYYYKLPVWAAGNVYFGGARPMSCEKDAVSKQEIVLKLTEEDDEVFLETNLGEALKAGNQAIVSTATLGEAFEPEEKFENPDGSPIVFDEDYFGAHREIRPLAGPFACVEDWMRVY